MITGFHDIYSSLLKFNVCLFKSCCYIHFLLPSLFNFEVSVSPPHSVADSGLEDDDDDEDDGDDGDADDAHNQDGAEEGRKDAQSITII
jgi:hypothetical protein